MKHALGMVCVLFAAVLGAQQTPPKTNLKVGDVAPDFSLPSTTGKEIKLSDYRGKKVVVLNFFPAAFTGGCTKELTAYQSGSGKFEALDAQLLAVSTDFIATLSHWSKELNASYPMLSDHIGTVAGEYGVLMPERRMANRATFVIDTDGKIIEIVEGSAAIDPSGAETACTRVRKKT